MNPIKTSYFWVVFNQYEKYGIENSSKLVSLKRIYTYLFLQTAIITIHKKQSSYKYILIQCKIELMSLNYTVVFTILEQN